MINYNSFTVPCAPGNFYDVERRACQFCPLSHYQDESGQLFCEPCPSGKITRRKGTNSPEGCIGVHLIHVSELYAFSLYSAFGRHIVMTYPCIKFISAYVMFGLHITKPKAW